MFEKKVYNLKIDEKFKNLIPPPTDEEYTQLEENIKKYGCREPICVWNETIIDGHNRYKICHQYSIPFYIQEIEFNSQEEIVTWICTNQLGRRNISEETRWYLIGKRYETEKKMKFHNSTRGTNQYTKNYNINTSDTERIKTSKKLGDEYNLAPATVKKYARYTKQLDILAKKNPEIISKILKGKIKISYENMEKLSKMQEKTVSKIKQQASNLTYSEIKKLLPKEKNKQIDIKVKETPVYDPDADIYSLSYTISSWISSIERTFTLVNFNNI